MGIRTLLDEKLTLFNKSVINANMQSCESIGVDVVYLGSTLQKSGCHDVPALEKLMHQNGDVVIVFTIQHLSSKTKVIDNSRLVPDACEHQRRLILRILICEELSMITHNLNNLTVFNFTS